MAVAKDYSNSRVAHFTLRTVCARVAHFQNGPAIEDESGPYICYKKKKKGEEKEITDSFNRTKPPNSFVMVASLIN